MASRESRATPVSGVRQVREHGPKCHGTAWDEPNATPSQRQNAHGTSPLLERHNHMGICHALLYNAAFVSCRREKVPEFTRRRDVRCVPSANSA